MTQRDINEPVTLTFDTVTSLRARILGGHIDVLATDGPPRLEVESLRNHPLTVTHEGGALTVSHPNLTWDGLLNWFTFTRRSVTITLAVPRSCPVQLGIVTASALVSGISGRTDVKSVSGVVTLEGLTGDVTAETVSGDIEAQSVAEHLSFTTVSGDVTVAGGQGTRLRGKTVSGKIMADMDIAPAGTAALHSVAGSLTLRLADSCAATVDLSSASGRLGADFPGVTRTQRPEREQLSGTLGDGSARLTASTVSGDITLLRREGAVAAQEGDPA